MGKALDFRYAQVSTVRLGYDSLRAICRNARLIQLSPRFLFVVIPASEPESSRFIRAPLRAGRSVAAPRNAPGFNCLYALLPDQLIDPFDFATNVSFFRYLPFLFLFSLLFVLLGFEFQLVYMVFRMTQIGFD